MGRFTNAWDELVVPDTVRAELEELVSRVRGRAEPTLALFTGEPGTGAGLATQVIAAELSRPLVELDAVAASARGAAGLATAVWRVLDEAARENAIVVFADADEVLSPQFGRRRPNQHELDVLTRCARYSGLVIFRSRVSGRLIPELQERFASVVRFPFPEAELRERVWRQALPPDAELEDEDITFLADSFRLAPGAIHVCCAAARRSALENYRRVGRSDMALALEEHYRDLLVSPGTRRALELFASGTSTNAPDAAEPAAPASADGAAPPSEPSPDTATPPAMAGPVQPAAPTRASRARLRWLRRRA